MGDRIWTPEREASIGAEHVPNAVARTKEFLDTRDAWYIVTKNVPTADGQSEAYDCEGAAEMRSRNGSEGIPLWDEVKTFLGRHPENPEEYIMIHCRGDRWLDFDKITSFLGYEPKRLDEEEAHRFGTQYGLVNPFNDFEGKKVTQVFDEDLLRPLGVLGSVMTNAGHRAYGVEIKPEQLPIIFPTSRTADVCTDDPELEDRRKWVLSPPKFGLLTGNGRRSGNLLEDLVEEVVLQRLGRHAQGGDVVLPHWIRDSNPGTGKTMEDERYHDARADIEYSVEGLCRAGAGVIAVSCNTIPKHKEEIRAITDGFGVPFVSMPEVAGQALKRRTGWDVIDLIAIKSVAALEHSAYTEPLDGIQVRRPRSKPEVIDKIAYGVKKNGPTLTGLSQLNGVLNRLDDNAKVLIALTELSLLFDFGRKHGVRNRRKSNREVIDTMDIYAEAIADFYINGKRKY